MKCFNYVYVLENNVILLLYVDTVLLAKMNMDLEHATDLFKKI